IDDATAAQIEQACTGLHAREGSLVNHVARLTGGGHVQRDEITLFEQALERSERAVVAHGQLLRDVEEYDAHAHGFCQHAHLATNAPVSDDPHGFTADFVRIFRTLLPVSRVHLPDAVGKLARKCDDFGDHELGDASSIRERSVEHRDALGMTGSKVDLIGPNAEAPDAEQTPGLLDDARRDLGLAANAQEVHVANALPQFLFTEGARQDFDVDSILFEESARGCMNTFE